MPRASISPANTSPKCRSTARRFQLNYANPRYVNVSIENQFVGHQFDDDRNEAVILPGVPAKTEVGLPAYNMTNITRLPHRQPAPRSVLRGAEPLRRAVLRRHESDDNWHAKTRQRRHPPAGRTVSANETGDRGSGEIPFERNSPSLSSPVSIFTWFRTTPSPLSRDSQSRTTPRTACPPGSLQEACGGRRRRERRRRDIRSWCNPGCPRTGTA